MKKAILKNLKDAIFSIVPVMMIMLLVSIILGFNIVTIVSIILSTILLILGICLFTYGADLSMIEIGKMVGSKLVKTKKPFLIAFISFLVGIIITVAEPDLKVLADQMTAIDNLTLILSIGVGVGLFLCLAAIRIIYQIDLKKIIIIFYGLILIFMLFILPELVPVSFDSGGVTTGPMSVPFIIAMGVGFSRARPRKEAKDNSFGLIALCSIGPILVMLVLSFFLSGNVNYEYNISEEFVNFSEMFSNYLNQIMPIIKEVTLSLLPILILFIIFDLITKAIEGKKLIRVLVGIIITFIGLILFFIGVNSGYMKIAYLIGMNMFEKYEYFLLPLGIVVGYVIVKAEPAVAVLTEQIEEITKGSISKKTMVTVIASGVAIAVLISMIRVITGISIIWFLLIGYIIAIILMFITPKIFTMVAFDSGGAVSGPMTTSFLLPLIIGVCYQNGGNVLTDAFGVVALVAMSPLITIQLLGVAYKIKDRKRIDISSIDESIVEYDWKCSNV